MLDLGGDNKDRLNIAERRGRGGLRRTLQPPGGLLSAKPVVQLAQLVDNRLVTVLVDIVPGINVAIGFMPLGPSDSTYLSGSPPSWDRQILLTEQLVRQQRQRKLSRGRTRARQCQPGWHRSLEG